ncbi:uncharacterized protein GGS22DRAFT_169991 [Annulohypoxylon maeteangense]|uniref:uncharacterized protein n=1 Tax=Annulohypoxylon maeteangense TaxID=1927788 RepID=UPI002007849E|nr:uncharacterized protein GGS22DRAFT_169991 [Annulohypoxylon maeteangense]KAI0882651.1 hypothetical protein GGS22DRAFT_169991 [Annulohypoxylon maeteangense]
MSLGALTTTFTPPADCTASSALYWVNTASTFYWLHGQPGQSSCFPDSYSPYQNQYYSPGVCPVGYTRACESISTGGDNSFTTRATCCPQGNYVCASTSSSYSYPWGPTLGCMSVYRVNTQTSFTTIDGTIAGGETAGTVTSLRAPGTIMAYGVVVQNSASTDTATTTTGSQTSGSSSIASETASSTAAAGAGESHGLSSGAAAGIGIGTALGVMAIGGLILWMFWSRRKKRTQIPQQELEAEAPPRGAATTPGSWSDTTWSSTPYQHPPPQQQHYPQQYPHQQSVVQVNWPPTELAQHGEPMEMSGETQLPAEKDGKSLNWRQR